MGVWTEIFENILLDQGDMVPSNVQMFVSFFSYNLYCCRIFCMKTAYPDYYEYLTAKQLSSQNYPRTSKS